MTTTPTAPAAELNATKLRELHEAATPGPWEADTLNSEGSYGSGGDTHEGFATTAIYDADGKVLLDALNSDAILVQEEWDEDGGRAYDLTSAANAALIAYLRNAVPDILALIEERNRLREETRMLHILRLDLRIQECLQDSAFKAGYKAGWNAGISEDNDRFKSAMRSTEHIAEIRKLKAERAALAGEKQ